MTIKIISEKISIGELKIIADEIFGDFVKAVVDVNEEIMAVGGELHSDEEALMLGEGSKQDNLWGINIYINKSAEDRIEFDSLINIKPRLNNRTQDVENPEIRKKIIEIVNKWIS